MAGSHHTLAQIPVGHDADTVPFLVDHHDRIHPFSAHQSRRFTNGRFRPAGQERSARHHAAGRSQDEGILRPLLMTLERGQTRAHPLAQGTEEKTRHRRLAGDQLVDHRTRDGVAHRVFDRDIVELSFDAVDGGEDTDEVTFTRHFENVLLTRH